MSIETFTRLQLAESQLKSAIGLFITGQDRFSVITLAGAADVLLTRLVLNAGRQPFTDHLLEAHRAEGGTDPSREVHGKRVNDLLFINQLKHLDNDDDGYVDMDPEECALGAILKAMANYLKLEGHQPDLFRAFRHWMVENLDHAKYNVHCDPNWAAPA